MSKGALYAPNRTGHSPVAEWDTEDRASVVRAETEFYALIRDRKCTIADMTPGRYGRGEDGVLIRSFDPSATELLAIPPMVSG